MKKLTKEQIEKAFKKVTDNDFLYPCGKQNVIGLDGVFASDELRCIADTMDEIFHGDKELNRIQKLKIKGFTAKDIKVIWGCEGERDRKGRKEYCYSFYIMKDGKDWDFYYGKSDQGAGDWWPDSEDEIYLSPITQFIPNGFITCCENVYKYHGSNKEALELLKECGYTLEKGEDL